MLDIIGFHFYSGGFARQEGSHCKFFNVASTIKMNLGSDQKLKHSEIRKENYISVNLEFK